jgi:signal transduction histidine kinase
VLIRFSAASESGCTPGAGSRYLKDVFSPEESRDVRASLEFASKPVTPNEVERLRRQVAELGRAVAARDEVLANLGHELRNPLSPLFLQLARLVEAASSEEPAAAPREWMAQQLQAAMARLQSLTTTLDRFLEASRPGGLTLELEVVDLARVVAEVASSMTSELEAARSELILLAPRPVIGLWDRRRVEQIVRNLMSNAVRYGAGEPIAVRVGAEDGVAQLRVTDRGIGIAPEDQERIFERYQLATERNGLGLGLWQVRRLCRAMGGDAEVESEPGKGSTFLVTLPGGGEGEPP